MVITVNLDAESIQGADVDTSARQDGYLLAYQAAGGGKMVFVAPSSGGSSQWTTSGQAIYYDGPVRIGRTDDDGSGAELQVNGAIKAAAATVGPLTISENWGATQLSGGSNLLVGPIIALYGGMLGPLTFRGVFNNPGWAIYSQASIGYGSHTDTADTQAGYLTFSVWGNGSLREAIRIVGTGTAANVLVGTDKDDDSGARSQIAGKSRAYSFSETPHQLTDAINGTVSPNPNVGCHQVLPMSPSSGLNRSIGNPSGTFLDGEAFTLKLIQPALGGETVSDWGDQYVWTTQYPLPALPTDGSGQTGAINVNGGFEDGTRTGWLGAAQLTVQTSTVHSGTYAGQLTAESTTTQAMQEVVPQSGSQWTIWINCPSGVDGLSRMVWDANGTALSETPITTPTSGWESHTADLSAYAGQTVRVGVEINNSSGTGVVYLDDCEVTGPVGYGACWAGRFKWDQYRQCWVIQHYEQWL